MQNIYKEYIRCRWRIPNKEEKNTMKPEEEEQLNTFFENYFDKIKDLKSFEKPRQDPKTISPLYS
jgi:hypothetical protein